MTTKIIAIALLFWLATVRLALQAAPVDLSDWMGALDGKKLLSELTIPGTHDSCALHDICDIGTGTVQCQDIPIVQQLAIGVRFLDLRCVIKEESFEMYHGVVDQQLTFDAVLKDCVGFLQSHRGETLLISVQKDNEYDDDAYFEKVFDSYASKNPDVWLLGEKLPTLAEARGKIVLLRRFNAKLPKGIPAVPGDWTDNSSSIIIPRPPRPTEIHVQDHYKLDHVEDKWPAVQSLLQEAFNGEKDVRKQYVLYINFTSGLTTFVVIPDITKVANTINPMVFNFFNTAAAGRYGVIVMDFADQLRCEKIIATNKNK